MSTYSLDAMIRDLELIKKRHGGDCEVFIELQQYRGGNLAYNVSEVLQFDPSADEDCTCHEDCTCTDTAEDLQCPTCNCVACSIGEHNPPTCWIVMGDQRRRVYDTPDWENVNDKEPGR